MREVLDRHGLPASALGLEVAETALVNPGSAAPVLDALKALGVRLLVDDFGTGFSSLSHLQQFRATWSRSTAPSWRTCARFPASAPS